VGYIVMNSWINDMNMKINMWNMITIHESLAASISERTNLMLVFPVVKLVVLSCRLTTLSCVYLRDLFVLKISGKFEWLNKQKEGCHQNYNTIR